MEKYKYVQTINDNQAKSCEIQKTKKERKKKFFFFFVERFVRYIQLKVPAGI